MRKCAAIWSHIDFKSDTPKHFDEESVEVFVVQIEALEGPHVVFVQNVTCVIGDLEDWVLRN